MNKWGVSKDEIEAAIRQVGDDRSRVEEYLNNQKWQHGDTDKSSDGNAKHVDEPSFQKKDLNEDETY